MRRIHADYFLKQSAGIRLIRADPRPIPQWLVGNTLARLRRSMAALETKQPSLKAGKVAEYRYSAIAAAPA